MSFMRETEHSLSLWFGAVGMITLVDMLIKIEKIYVIANDPLAIFSRPSVVVSLLISLVVVVVYLFMAIKLRDLIVTGPNFIKAVLIVAMLYLAVTGALLVILIPKAPGLFWVGLEFIIDVYLLFNVNRIVRELKE